ncbi:hypothetical protein ACF0H5_015691 [Mactra antiquata]
MSERMYHPCHKLSVPSAKLFWCRHCMQMFENAIARWKHSKKCHAIPGYKPKDHEARVVQLYVKPDKVSYTSNIVPGQTVYHKPHVKKVSTDLKCVICDTKFDSLYDMRNHVKEPCQRSDIKPQSVDTTQFQLGDKEDHSDTLSSLKIRRVETEEEGVLSQNTALSVLAEASKHVESLSNGDIIIEQVIEEEVPQVDDNCAHISNIVEDSSSVAVFQDSVTFDDKLNQEVIVAYPRPTVKPELGIVTVSFQSADGQQILQDNLDLQTIQECLRETALGSTIGQVIEVGSQDKVHQYVVGFQGVVWPLDENQVPHLNAKDSTENAALFQSEPPPLLCHPTVKSEASVDLNCTNSVPDSVDIDIAGNIQAGILAPTSNQKTVNSQEVIGNTSDSILKTEPSFHLAGPSQLVDTNYSYQLDVAHDTRGNILQTSNPVVVENPSSPSSDITELKPVIIDTKSLNIEPNSSSLIEVLLKSGAIVPQGDINNSVSNNFNEVYTLASISQSQQTVVQDVSNLILHFIIGLCSSPEPKMLMVSFCGGWMVRRRALSTFHC